MIALDIEASGTDYSVHSIVSIGAVDINHPERRFYVECRVWDGAKIMEDALKVNGFTEAEITDKNKLTEAEAVRQFIEWSQHMDDRTILGQNPSFDRDMLRAATLRAKLNFDFSYRTLDTHTIAYTHMSLQGIKPPHDEQRRRTDLTLDKVLEYCGIPEEPHPHNALTGAMCHAEVGSRLLFNKKLLPEFSQYEIPW